MTDLKITIRQFQVEDFSSVKNIYQQGIDTKNATFETLAPEWEIFDKKFLAFPRLVALAENTIVGWATLSAISSRKVYEGVCEVSVYVHPAYHKRGIGRKLLNELITVSEQHNIWTLQASIFPENKASIKIHKEFGFREVGIREKIGKMDGTWRDTVLLERRSKLAGIY